MTKIESPGFCSRECEIDSYVAAVNELGLMTEVAEHDPFPDKNHAKTVGIMKLVAAFQANILEECQTEAAQRPCEGYMEQGVKLGGIMTGMTVHCPVVLRHFASSME